MWAGRRAMGRMMAVLTNSAIAGDYVGKYQRSAVFVCNKRSSYPTYHSRLMFRPRCLLDAPHGDRKDVVSSCEGLAASSP